MNRIPEDVNFDFLPLTTGPWTHYSKVHYVVKEKLGYYGLVEHGIFWVFEEMYEKNNRLSDLDQLAAFLYDFMGIDKEETEREYNSLSMARVMERDKLRLVSLGITGVPSMVVDGKYVVNPIGGVGYHGMLSTVDQLIEKIRMERHIHRAE